MWQYRLQNKKGKDDRAAEIRALKWENDHKTKKTIYSAILESVDTYGSETPEGSNLNGGNGAKPDKYPVHQR